MDELSGLLVATEMDRLKAFRWAGCLSITTVTLTHVSQCGYYGALQRCYLGNNLVFKGSLGLIDCVRQFGFEGSLGLSEFVGEVFEGEVKLVILVMQKFNCVLEI